MTKCADCKFFVERWRDDLSSAALGECRRRPPVVDQISDPIETEDGGTIGNRLFPAVAPADWCGEFRARIV